MKKLDDIDPFLTRVKDIRDDLTIVKEMPPPKEMVRLALNSVTEDWDNFIQGILGRDMFPGWD